MISPCFVRSLVVHKGIIAMKPFIYETMYILRPDLGEEMTDQAIAKYQTILRDQGAENIETQHRGKRRLAYEIGKHRDGVYVQMNYTAPGAAIFTLERAMRLSEEVIRYLTIKQDVPDAPEAEAEGDEAQNAAPEDGGDSPQAEGDAHAATGTEEQQAAAASAMMAPRKLAATA